MIIQKHIGLYHVCNLASTLFHQDRSTILVKYVHTHTHTRVGYRFYITRMFYRSLGLLFLHTNYNLDEHRYG